MFAKFGPAKLTRQATVNTGVLHRLKQQALRFMPRFSEIEAELFPRRTLVTVYHLEDHVELYTVEKRPVLVELGTREVIPHLQIAIERPGLLRSVYVDDGAVRALIRGAELMAPGIKNIPEPFDSDAVIEVRVLGSTVPFAIGITELAAAEIRPATKGTAIRIVHILKDGLWDLRRGLTD
jgi:PUA domain protein